MVGYSTNQLLRARVSTIKRQALFLKPEVFIYSDYFHLAAQQTLKNTSCCCSDHSAVIPAKGHAEACRGISLFPSLLQRNVDLKSLENVTLKIKKLCFSVSDFTILQENIFRKFLCLWNSTPHTQTKHKFNDISF